MAKPTFLILVVSLSLTAKASPTNFLACRQSEAAVRLSSAECKRQLTTAEFAQSYTYFSTPELATELRERIANSPEAVPIRAEIERLEGILARDPNTRSAGYRSLSERVAILRGTLGLPPIRREGDPFVSRDGLIRALIISELPPSIRSLVMPILLLHPIDRLHFTGSAIQDQLARPEIQPLLGRAQYLRIHVDSRAVRDYISVNRDTFENLHQIVIPTRGENSLRGLVIGGREVSIFHLPNAPGCTYNTGIYD